jgi:hypothetical protein
MRRITWKRGSDIDTIKPDTAWLVLCCAVQQWHTPCNTKTACIVGCWARAAEQWREGQHNRSLASEERGKLGTTIR